MDGEKQEVILAEQVTPGVGEESSSLPSGTVTFLFTDIEGSTRLLEQLREQYAQVLSEHREVLRTAIKNWHGHEIDTQGDSFFVAFPRATDAIACVIEAQRRLYEHAWPQGVSVRVRMGLHTGEPLVVHTGYVGMDVHRAARVAAAGHGGQVLLSQATRDLVYQDLPSDAHLQSLGEHKLKDIRFPQSIFQLDIEGLPCEFPALRTLSLTEEPATPGEAPFKGLQYFDEADASLFFGRSQVTARLVETVSQQRFLAVVGASGSGKSSVVRAGLVPALKARKHPHWQVKVITPSSHPLEALAICLTSGSESVSATATLIDDMQNNLRSLHLYCQKNLVHDQDSRILLVVDQFEELFTLCRSESERLAFVTNLLYAACTADGKETVLITLRADFYEHLAQYVGLREMVAAHQVYIGAMDASELRQAIEEPAKQGGWEFAPGLVELILHEIGAEGIHQPEPGALPLLSHALLETWNHRRGNLMSLKAYAESGGVRGAIARTAESVFYGELNADQQAIAKDIFLRLTELGEGTQDTRRRISIHELIPPGPAVESEQVRTVLSKLADARLIITGEDTVEVAHEALIREWPALREWLDADREGLRLHRQMTEAAQEWVLLERDAGALYRGTRLNQAVEWAMANPRSLSAMEQDFLEASHQAAEREQAEREAHRQREMEAAQKLAETERQRAEEQGRSAKRLRRRAWLLTGVLVLALILAAAAGMFGQQADTNSKLANQNLATAQSAEQRAVGQQATAESEAQQRATAEAFAQDSARLATSRYLTTAALNNLAVNSQLSAHLALLAYQTYPTNEAETALHLALPELRLIKSTSPTNLSSSALYSVWLARGGDLLFELTPEGIEVVDQAAGTRSIITQGKNCDTFISDPDGRWVNAWCTTAEGQPEMRVWETGTQKLVFTTSLVDNVWFELIPPSPTSPLQADICLASNLECQVWDVYSGKKLFVLTGHSLTPELGVSTVRIAVSQDVKRIASYGSDGLVILWDRETGKKLLQFDTHSKGIGVAVFSPDGSRLATWALDNTIKVWDLTTLSPGPVLESVITNDFIDLCNLSFNPDGTRLAAGSADGRVRLWDPHTGKLQISLTGHKNMSASVTFSQDGKRLFTISNDNTIKEWDVTPDRELLTLDGWTGTRSFSPDGMMLALSRADGELFIVNSQTGAVLRHWQAHSGWIADIAWSPDGKRLATTNGANFRALVSNLSDKTTIIWDASTGQQLKKLHQDKDWGFFALAWSPDGSRIAASSIQGIRTCVFDSVTGDLLLQFTLPGTDSSWSLAYSPDGKKIATGAGQAGQDVFVWDAATGKQVFTYHTPHSATCLAFAPDSQRLAACQTDGSIYLFKILENGADVQSLPGGGQILNAVAISPDGTFLASGDVLGKVRLWDLKTMQKRLEMATFPDALLNVTFSPDSRRLVASSAGGATYIYALPTDELIGLVRSRIILPMDPGECKQYLGTETCPPGE